MIEVDTVKTAADIVQSMASYFGFKMLRSECHFDEIREIPKMFSEIQSLQNSLSQIDSDIAELGMVIMADLVRLEDGRILEDYAQS